MPARMMSMEERSEDQEVVGRRADIEGGEAGGRGADGAVPEGGGGDRAHPDDRGAVPARGAEDAEGPADGRGEAAAGPVAGEAEGRPPGHDDGTDPGGASGADAHDLRRTDDERPTLGGPPKRGPPRRMKRRDQNAEGDVDGTRNAWTNRW